MTGRVKWDARAQKCGTRQINVNGWHLLQGATRPPLDPGVSLRSTPG